MVALATTKLAAPSVRRAHTAAEVVPSDSMMLA
jgi:hypothetical protein